MGEIGKRRGPPTRAAIVGESVDSIDGRYHCNAQAVINRDGGERTLVRLVNFSRTGCRIAGFIGLAVDEIIGLATQGLACQPCRVIWVVDNVAGCQFLAPLALPAFETLLALARSVDRR